MAHLKTDSLWVLLQCLHCILTVADQSFQIKKKKGGEIYGISGSSLAHVIGSGGPVQLQSFDCLSGLTMDFLLSISI